MRRGAPEVLVAVLIALLLVSYVGYTQRVVAGLRREAQRSSTSYARIYRALSDTSEAQATQALLDMARSIREQGVPLVVTDVDGRPTAHANLPDVPAEAPADDPRVAAWIPRLDRANPPVVIAGVGRVHFGDTRLVGGLRVIPAIQAVTAAILLLAGVYIVRTRSHAMRERIWAGMARESAHQLGTPLSSLSGWIELLEEAEGNATTQRAVSQMRADVERLDRVARRFERIGRRPKREPVDLSAMVERIADYFRARVPTRANAIAIDVATAPPVMVEGDPVLLEWVLEVLVKNAIDALSGRGGRVSLSAETTPEGGARLRVADDGPGIPRELRERIFDPGYTTKTGGWGIGLSLAKRIVEDSHRGTLALAPADRGATFEIILR
ncbi:MAG: sensor histidine kinase [Gemmatimonadaceae bacterium]